MYSRLKYVEFLATFDTLNEAILPVKQFEKMVNIFLPHISPQISSHASSL